MTADYTQWIVKNLPDSDLCRVRAKEPGLVLAAIDHYEWPQGVRVQEQQPKGRWIFPPEFTIWDSPKTDPELARSGPPFAKDPDEVDKMLEWLHGTWWPGRVADLKERIGRSYGVLLIRQEPKIEPTLQPGDCGWYVSAIVAVFSPGLDEG